jgi:hypothetical protein
MTSAISLRDEQQTSPLAMVQRAFEVAIERGEGMAVVNVILAEQRAMLERNDRIAFQEALRRIQNDLKPILKDAENKETHSKFASAEAVDNAIQSLIERERMTLSFEPRVSEKPDTVLIVGLLSLGGYTKEYPLEMPADGKGAKGGGVMSRTHATGSAITYGKRYLKNAIFDLRFKEKDDDGNAAGGKAGTLGDEQFISLRDNIAGAGNEDELKRFYLAALKAAEDVGDVKAGLDFDREKNKRFRELKGQK